MRCLCVRTSALDASTCRRNSSADDTVVTVAKPLTTNFITGGGALINQSSAGLVPGAADLAFPLYSLEDAVSLRNHILSLFESAEADPELIDDGVLTSWLLNSSSARQLGLATTGHASRGLAGPPGVGLGGGPTRFCRNYP